MFRLTESGGSQLQPFLDVKNVIQNEELLQSSIEKRQLTRRQVKDVRELFDKAQEYRSLRDKVKQVRAENTEKCQALLKEETNKPEKSQELRDLKEKGRLLREEIREAENKFNEINDQLVDFILSLPNVLDKDTPTENATLLKEVMPTKSPPWENPDYTAIETHCGMLGTFIIT